MKAGCSAKDGDLDPQVKAKHCSSSRDSGSRSGPVSGPVMVTGVTQASS